MKILSLFLFIQFTTILVVGQNSIQNSINEFNNDPELKHASISFSVVDLNSNEVVASLNAQQTLPTASTAKLFSTATALKLLGPNYRAKTRIYYDGTIDSSGVLHGNIWIRGGGDPSIGSKYFYDEKNQLPFLKDWVLELKAFGIKKVEGSIIGDASEFGYEGAPDGWNWSDLGNYYGAGPSGLTIYDNLVRYYFNVPSYAGQLTTVNSIKPEVPNLKYHNYVVSSTRKGDNAYLYGAPYSYDRFGTGTLPVGSNNFLVKGSLPDPEYQFAYELDKVFRDNLIEISGQPKAVRLNDLEVGGEKYDKMHLIHVHEGDRLIEIINYTNKRSVNLFAEHMLNLIGYEKTQNGSTKSGIQVFESYWSTRFSTDGLELNDGSGLSRTNAISAQHFIKLLEDLYHSDQYHDFVNSLPVAGESGTLRNVCKGQTAHGKMIAKSGSMTRIKSYAGYINGLSGKNYAFALIVNNYTCSSSALRHKMERVFNKIAAN